MPDRDAHVILYCASGNRSAYGARTLEQDLGYTNVSSMTGGITLWKDRGYEVADPAHAHPRAARALLAPHADPRDRRRRPAEAARRQGSAARRRWARLADRPVSRRGRCRHARARRRRRRRPVEPAAPGDPHDRPRRRAEGRLRRGDDPRAQPRRERRQVPRADRRLEHRRDHLRLRRDRRRGRQLPHALPAQRRHRAPEDPRRLGLDPRLRRPAVRVQTVRRPVLPLPVPRAAPGRARALLRRQRRARRAARDDGPAAGDRGDQADPRRSANPRSGACCCTTPSAATLSEVKVHRDPECPICSRPPEEITDEELGVFPDYEAFCAAAG